MSQIRQPAVANLFYPGDAKALTGMLDSYLSGAETDTAPPKALIVPHAGYLYSGPIAATAYATLSSVRRTISRVVLLGPSHRVPLHGLAVSMADAFATPLGEVRLDREAIDRALAFHQVRPMEAAHALEHSLEVQLPFLQRVLDDFALVPFVVGDATEEAVAEVLESLWGGPETLVIISTDLSHYLDYEAATQLDRMTSVAIETLSADEIGPDQACGRYPLCGLLTLAKRLGLHVDRLDLRNSGDTAGTRDKVVGYGAYALH